VHILAIAKGFGSENMSQLKMLTPADGVEGVKKFVLKVVEEAGPNPCPPLVVGIGIGGSFELAALMAKRATSLPITRSNKDPRYARLEEELERDINRLGIGPAGYGGQTTALKVHIVTAPTHIAGLPVAINICCHVARHADRMI
jgi:fumarate hydratase subunit alpha